MKKKSQPIYEYHDKLTMTIGITLVGTALAAEEYRNSILAIKHTLDCVTISRAVVKDKVQ